MPLVSTKGAASFDKCPHVMSLDLASVGVEDNKFENERKKE